MSLTNWPVRTPRWILTYQGVDITADVSPMVTSLIYIDELSGSAGEIEVELEDSGKVWQSAWYPQQGDLVNLLIGYDGEPLLPCGQFQVDDLQLSGPPDVFHLRCISAFITQAMRTRLSAAFENQTLTQIAQTIATKYNLKVIGAPNQLNLSFARLTQKNETDLAFLHRIAQSNNYDFTIRGDKLVFYSRNALESAAPVSTLGRSDTLEFSFRDKTHRVFKAARVSYQSPIEKALITSSTPDTSTVPGADIDTQIARCENTQQAQLRAQSAIHRSDMSKVTANLTVTGTTSLSAGNTITINGFGVFDGVYLISTARHELTRRTGYTTQIEAYRPPSGNG